jgi:hypothetical protein
MSKSTKVNSPIDKGRREALLQIGRFAAYTAPTVTGLLIAEKAMAKSPRGGNWSRSVTQNFFRSRGRR